MVIALIIFSIFNLNANQCDESRQRHDPTIVGRILASNSETRRLSHIIFGQSNEAYGCLQTNGIGGQNSGIAGYVRQIVLDNPCFNSMADSFYERISELDQRYQSSRPNLGDAAGEGRYASLEKGFLWEMAMETANNNPNLAIRILGVCGHDDTAQGYNRCPTNHSVMFLPESLGEGVGISNNLRDDIVSIQAPNLGENVLPAKYYHTLGSAFMGCILREDGVSRFMGEEYLETLAWLYRTKRISDDINSHVQSFRNCNCSLNEYARRDSVYESTYFTERDATILLLRNYTSIEIGDSHHISANLNPLRRSYYNPVTECEKRPHYGWDQDRFRRACWKLSTWLVDWEWTVRAHEAGARFGLNQCQHIRGQLNLNESCEQANCENQNSIPNFVNAIIDINNSIDEIPRDQRDLNLIAPNLISNFEEQAFNMSEEEINRVCLHVSRNRTIAARSRPSNFNDFNYWRLRNCLNFRTEDLSEEFITTLSNTNDINLFHELITSIDTNQDLTPINQLIESLISERPISLINQQKLSQIISRFGFSGQVNLSRLLNFIHHPEIEDFLFYHFLRIIQNGVISLNEAQTRNLFNEAMRYQDSNRQRVILSALRYLVRYQPEAWQNIVQDNQLLMYFNQEHHSRSNEQFVSMLTTISDRAIMEQWDISSFRSSLALELLDHELLDHPDFSTLSSSLGNTLAINHQERFISYLLNRSENQEAATTTQTRLYRVLLEQIGQENLINRNFIDFINLQSFYGAQPSGGFNGAFPGYASYPGYNSYPNMSQGVGFNFTGHYLNPDSRVLPPKIEVSPGNINLYIDTINSATPEDKSRYLAVLTSISGYENIFERIENLEDIIGSFNQHEVITFLSNLSDTESNREIWEMIFRNFDQITRESSVRPLVLANAPSVLVRRRYLELRSQNNQDQLNIFVRDAINNHALLDIIPPNELREFYDVFSSIENDPNINFSMAMTSIPFALQAHARRNNDYEELEQFLSQQNLLNHPGHISAISSMLRASQTAENDEYILPQSLQETIFTNLINFESSVIEMNATNGLILSSLGQPLVHFLNTNPENMEQVLELPDSKFNQFMNTVLQTSDPRRGYFITNPIQLNQELISPRLLNRVEASIHNNQANIQTLHFLYQNQRESSLIYDNFLPYFISDIQQNFGLSSLDGSHNFTYLLNSRDIELLLAARAYYTLNDMDEELQSFEEQVQEYFPEALP